MHELAVTQGILNVALQAAEQAGARHVIAIDLVIGDLSTMVDDSVQFYFDILSQGTAAEGAALHFDRRPAVATCKQCRQESPVSLPLPSCCPKCGSSSLAITGGKACYVQSIEVEDHEDTGGQVDSERQRPGGGREPRPL